MKTFDLDGRGGKILVYYMSTNALIPGFCMSFVIVKQRRVDISLILAIIQWHGVCQYLDVVLGYWMELRCKFAIGEVGSDTDGATTGSACVPFVQQAEIVSNVRLMQSSGCVASSEELVALSTTNAVPHRRLGCAWHSVSCVSHLSRCSFALCSSSTSTADGFTTIPFTGNNNIYWSRWAFQSRRLLLAVGDLKDRYGRDA